MTHEQIVDAIYDEQLHMEECIAENCSNNCKECSEKLVREYEDNLLQSFAQWLWDNRYLTDEAFTVRLVEQCRENKGGSE